MQSYASDLAYGVTPGNVITAKHCLLSLGLHNMAGQKKLLRPSQILQSEVMVTNVVTVLGSEYSKTI